MHDGVGVCQLEDDGLPAIAGDQYRWVDAAQMNWQSAVPFLNVLGHFLGSCDSVLLCCVFVGVDLARNASDDSCYSSWICERLV